METSQKFFHGRHKRLKKWFYHSFTGLALEQSSRGGARLLSSILEEAADPHFLKCCRLPGAGRGHGALPDGLPDEAAVGEQRGRGEPGPATRQVWPGADCLVQQARATCQSALTPRTALRSLVHQAASSRSCSHSYSGLSKTVQWRRCIKGEVPETATYTPQKLLDIWRWS